MTQQSPPNNPDIPDQAPDASEPSFAQGPDADRNPYYRRDSYDQQTDLDANSPELRSTEAQRLNRKAILFLGGTVALLLLLGYFALRGGDEPAPVATPATDSQMSIPELPSAPPEAPADVPPVDLVQEPVAGLPPLPPPEPSYGNDYRTPSEPLGPQPPTLMQRRMLNAGSSATDAGGGAMQTAQTPIEARESQRMLELQNAMAGLQPGGVPAPTVATVGTSAQFMSNPNALLVRGTYLRCVLETRIITDVPGFTSCIVTEPIYSVNGKRLLLPKGSKILGRYDEGADIARVAVIWDRIITPTGIDVNMSSPGVDGLGGAGHPGDYNAHWGSKIASALLISLISDAFQWAAAEHGPRSTTTYSGIGGTSVIEQPFESATARSMERLANQALQKSASRSGTVTINQGTVVNVYVAQDVDFSGVLAVR